jgi:hypothetical protein
MSSGIDKRLEGTPEGQQKYAGVVGKAAARQAAARTQIEQRNGAPVPRSEGTKSPIPTGPVSWFVKRRIHKGQHMGTAGQYMYAKLETMKADRQHKTAALYEQRPRWRRIAYRVGDVAAAGAIVYAAHKGWDFTHPAP